MPNPHCTNPQVVQRGRNAVVHDDIAAPGGNCMRSVLTSEGGTLGSV